MFNIGSIGKNRTIVPVDQDGKMIVDVQAAMKFQAMRTVQIAELIKKRNQ